MERMQSIVGAAGEALGLLQNPLDTPLGLKVASASASVSEYHQTWHEEKNDVDFHDYFRHVMIIVGPNGYRP